MDRKLTIGVAFMAAVLAITIAGSADAQTPSATGVDCPQWIEDQMGFANEVDTLCDAYKQGMGGGTDPEGTAIRFRFAPGGSPACGAGSTRFPGKGQLIFVEPSGCTVSGATTCPGQITDGNLIGAPQLGVSFQEASVRTDLGSVVISAPMSFRHGDNLNRSLYTRYDCNGPLPDSITGANGRCIGGTNLGAICTQDSDCGGVLGVCSLSELVDMSECTGTIAVWREEIKSACVGGATPGATCASDADCGGGLCDFDATIAHQWGVNNNANPSDPDPCQRTGDALCCQSSPSFVCPNVLGHQQYPVDPAGGLGCLVNIPVNQPIDDRRILTAPIVFDDQVGSVFRMPRTWTRAGQEFGNCSDDEREPCSAFDNPGGLDGDAYCADLGVGFCNLGEPGLRVNASDMVQPIGLPDDFRCNHVAIDLRGFASDASGTPGTSVQCGIQAFWQPGEGSRDPQAGCFLRNFGSYTVPDLDCNGLDDRFEPGGQGVDFCPAIAEVDGLADSNGDGIGDECQCGDVSGDGAITGVDIGGIALCANGATNCDATQVDGDGDGSTTSLDIAGVVSVVNGGATSTLLCAQNGTQL